MASLRSQRDNIGEKELQALKVMAAHLMTYDAKALGAAMKAQELIEVNYDET